MASHDFNPSLNTLEGFDDNLDDDGAAVAAFGGSGEADADADALDPDAAPVAVAGRIEALMTAYVEALQRGQLPTLSLASPPDAPTAPPTILSFTARGGAAAPRTARLMLVLAAAHAALTSRRTVTLRDLYYALKTAGAVSAPAPVAAAVADAARLVGAPREALAFRAAPRGAVAGAIVVDEGGGPADLRRVGPAGRALPGCARAARALARGAVVAAAHLVIVEKDAVFERLCEDRVWERVCGGAVLVTGRGVLDRASRAFAAALRAAHPHLTVTGLVDWNPAGAGILAVWRTGACRASAPTPAAAAAGLALPSCGWLGARAPWLTAAPASAFTPLTRRDGALAATLAGGAFRGLPAWRDELAAMAARGGKADLDAVAAGGAGLGALAGWVAGALNAGDWLEA